VDKTVVAKSADGAPWEIEASPNVPGNDSILGSVACAVVSAGQRCAAVGIHGKLTTGRNPTLSVLIEMDF
jgi:hypothetical protein